MAVVKFLPTIALGGALGGALRYGFDHLAVEVGLTAFPWATLFVNLSGSLLIGWLAWRWASGGAARPHPGKWHFWMTGVCGGYTTFSSFAWQLLEMLEGGGGRAAGLYAAASVGFGLLAVWLGLSLALRGGEGAKAAEGG